jgi:hypothetical protein
LSDSAEHALFGPLCVGGVLRALGHCHAHYLR